VDSGTETASELLLTRERLAEFSGFSESEVDECERAGIIGRVDGGYRGIELIKLQIVRQVAEHHGGLSLVLEKYRQGGYSLSLLDIAMPSAQRLSNLTYAQLYDRLGVPAEEINSLMRAAGLPIPDPVQPARLDEVEAFENYATIRALPIPADARLHALRITAESLRRTAEVQSELFRDYVVQPLLQRFKQDPQEANTLISEISGRANPTVSAVTLWLYQRYLEYQTLRNATELMEESVAGDTPGTHRSTDPTVAFVDLVGFTPLSTELGDSEAAELARRFTERMLDVSVDHGGRVVKTMGDGAMLFFDSSVEAVRASLDLLEELPRAGLPPLRVGLHRGPVVAQSGDYYGSTVNLAARITDYARPNEVLVSSSVLPESVDGIALEEIGEVTLKGVAQPVHLLRARRRDI
jgi:class 3 adenylate cyclase